MTRPPLRTTAATTPPVLDDGRPRLVAKGLGDLIAVLPYRLGFVPEQSLVLLQLAPPAPGRERSQLGGLVRTDLPDRVDDAPAVVADAVRMWLQGSRVPANGRRVAIVLVYDTTGATGHDLRPGRAARAALAELRSALAASDTDVHEVLLVTSGRYRSLTCRNRVCCPAHGTAFPAADQDRIAAEAVAQGLTVAPSRQASLPETEPLADDLVEQAARARAEAEAGPWTPAERGAAIASFAAERARYQQPGDVRRVAPEVAGTLLRAFEDVSVRDAVLLDGVPGEVADRAVGALVLDAVDAPRERSSWVSAAMDVRPDHDRCVAGAALAVDLARHAPGAGGAGAWAVAAWIHWSLGDFVRAGACAESAVRADPAHRLGGLVWQAVLGGVRIRPSADPAAGPAADRAGDRGDGAVRIV